jgi:hypothetical protein
MQIGIQWEVGAANPTSLDTACAGMDKTGGLRTRYVGIAQQ